MKPGDNYGVSCVCSLCSGRVTASGRDSGDNRGEISQQAEAMAYAAGFVPIPKIWEEHRRRYEGWICRPCRAEVAAMSAAWGSV